MNVKGSESKSASMVGVIAKYKAINGLTNPKIAKKLGVSLPTFANWKSDPLKMRIADWLKLCAILGVPDEEMLTPFQGKK
jgi:hypothetical protein